MQCLQSSQLEARRVAWKFCSTSSAQPTQSKPLGCSHLPTLPLPRAHRARQRHRCRAQKQETRTEEAGDAAAQQSNGATGASSNGSKPSRNGARNGGTSRSLGSYDETRQQPKKRDKGTLDHLLERSTRVEPSNASRAGDDQDNLEQNEITPASSWLPYSPVKGFEQPIQKQSPLQAAESIRRKLCRVPEIVNSFITFRVQQLMLSNTIVKLLAVFLFATPAVVVGGEIYSILTGSSAMEGFLKIYSVLYIIPGVNVLAEDTVPSFVLVNAIFLLGTFTFAVVLGVVSDDIGNELKAIRSGNYPVVIKDHVLLLNWNRQTQPLLRQLALSGREDGVFGGQKQSERGIVVLAQHDKTWMDNEVQAALKGYVISWQTREGAPYSANDLARVSAGSASTIILLRPEDAEVVEPPTADCPLPGQSPPKSRKGNGQGVADQEVAALLSINSQREPPSRSQNIIVQAPEDTKDAVAAAKRVISQSQFNALGLRDRRDMTRLIAQSALQPGVASVQCAILQKAPGSVSFYMRKFDNLEGLEYEDVRRRFSGAVVCGYIRKNSAAPILNPAADEKLEKDDRIIVLAARGKIFAAKDEWAPEYRELGDIFQGVKADDWNPPAVEVGPRKVIVAGWCGKVGDLTASLTMFAPRGTEVTMICECAPEGMPTGEIDGLNFFHLPGDPHNTNCLEEAGVANADAIIIGPADDLDPKEADAQMLSELMLLQDILIASKRDRSAPVHVVAVVRCSSTVKVANYMVRDLSRGCMTAELIQPDELVAGLIAQVSTEPGLAALLSQTIDSAQGIQVRLREPEAFQLDDVRAISFAEVAERARALQETALGFITRQGALVLAPPAGSTHVFRNTDRVVVFAGKQDDSEWA